MLTIDSELTPAGLLPAIARMWDVSARCIDAIDRTWDPADGSPVFTIEGRYTAQGWTEWTQGFQFGAALLQFDGTGDERFLELGRRQTIERMAPHVTHTGVHDHGFNNISTYGNLRRLMLEGRIPHDANELSLYELALKCSGAVQASRWTGTAGLFRTPILVIDRPKSKVGSRANPPWGTGTAGLFRTPVLVIDRPKSKVGSRANPPWGTGTADGGGFIHSFNGPHSLFCDTIRSLRSLALAHRLGHRLLGENDEPICLLRRLIQHAEETASYNVYYGEGRDAYDVRGRVAHESIFNTNDGRYRCPSTQQGYSPFTTWTRGLAWIMLGYPELLEFLAVLDDDEFEPFGGRDRVETMMLEAATAACDFYIENTPTDGVPYWDTGAPRLVLLGEYTDRPSDPFNDQEPVDSSAAAIGCQGLLRLGRVLTDRGESDQGRTYFQAGLTVLRTLLGEPYLSTSPDHQGLLLHAVYHRPRGWDHVPDDREIPCGESCLWGDYHLQEAALTVQRMANEEPYYTFFGPSPA